MSVNSLQRKKPSEQMAEYVAGRNRVNVMPRQTTANYGQPVSQGQARVAEIARQKKQQQIGVPVAPQTPAEIMGYQQARGQASPQQGGTVLTQEQVLANNINDIIKRMNEIMSQPGNLMSPSASPYYNIYMEQYRKNAEAAEANAFARSVASSGGYGSSYATMAGQQAYRDTMEGFTELTPSLVQTKGQAMSDLMAQYQLAKGLKEELDTKAATAGVNSYTRADGTTVEVDDAKVQGAYDYISQTVQNSGGSLAQIENTVRENLKNQRNAEGEAYTEDEINAAMERYKRVEEAALTDMQKVTNETLRESLDNLEQVDITVYGYTPEEIEKMDEEEHAQKAKEALLEKAGKMVKVGQMKLTDFTRILSKDIGEEMNDIVDDKAKYPFRRIASVIIAMDDYEAKGYITSDMKNTLIKEIWGKLEGKPLGAALKLNKSVDMLSLLNKEQEEAIKQLMKFM